ncbi:MAG: nucleoside deaminase [Eubacteriaceae bacterium]|nr:nucleoside deaminase [Eubacteriaceae bacterium]
MTPDQKMEFVIELAKKAMDSGEFPIAAAIYSGDELIASAFTTENAEGRFLVHAEQKALMEADLKKLPIKARRGLELYTNLEPCLMCLGTAISSFLGKIYYAVEALDDGAVELVSKEYARRKQAGTPLQFPFPEVHSGLLRSQSIQLFREFVNNNEGKPGIAYAKTIAELQQ